MFKLRTSKYRHVFCDQPKVEVSKHYANIEDGNVHCTMDDEQRYDVRHVHLRMTDGAPKAPKENFVGSHLVLSCFDSIYSM